MFKDDKNIVSAIYRDEAWVDPKTIAAAERLLHIRKYMLELLAKEIDQSGKVVVEELDSYFYKQYVTEYKASIAILSVDEYKRLKSVEAAYNSYLESES